MKIAHIINPFKVSETNNLFRVQQLTIDSIKHALDFCRNDVSVEVYSAQYEEDVEFIPSWMIKTDHLTRSVLDFGTFTTQRKLPLLIDIIERLVNASDADYLVYTNVDITLTPNFYSTLHQFCQKQMLAFAINRRTISDQYCSKNLYELYAEIGKMHPGHDCFVFNRKFFDNFDFGNICIGARYVGRIFLWNLICQYPQFHEFRNLHLTFHLGDDKTWENEANNQFLEHNRKEAFLIYDRISQKFGPFSSAHPIFPFIEGVTIPRNFKSRLNIHFSRIMRIINELSNNNI